MATRQSGRRTASRGTWAGGANRNKSYSTTQASARSSVRPTLRRGSSGSDVEFLQQTLKGWGYDPGPIDGIFGALTEKAVKYFQAAKGLVVDEIVGKNTWAALTSKHSAPPPTNPSSRAESAQRILNRGEVALWQYSPTNTSTSDGADARSNMRDTAASKSAKRSDYGNAPGGTVNLDTRLLSGLLELAKSYSFRVTSLAGGSHSSNSRHYAGIAVDIDEINGVHVSSSNPHYRAFMQQCRTLGAEEVLGPGNKDHDTHVHCAWPRS